MRKQVDELKAQSSRDAAALAEERHRRDVVAQEHRALQQSATDLHEELAAERKTVVDLHRRLCEANARAARAEENTAARVAELEQLREAARQATDAANTSLEEYARRLHEAEASFEAQARRSHDAQARAAARAAEATAERERAEEQLNQAQAHLHRAQHRTASAEQQLAALEALSSPPTPAPTEAPATLREACSQLGLPPNPRLSDSSGGRANTFADLSDRNRRMMAAGMAKCITQIVNSTNFGTELLPQALGLLSAESGGEAHPDDASGQPSPKEGRDVIDAVLLAASTFAHQNNPGGSKQLLSLVAPVVRFSVLQLRWRALHPDEPPAAGSMAYLKGTGNTRQAVRVDQVNSNGTAAVTLCALAGSATRQRYPTAATRGEAFAATATALNSQRLVDPAALISMRRVQLTTCRLIDAKRHAGQLFPGAPVERSLATRERIDAEQVRSFSTDQRELEWRRK